MAQVVLLALQLSIVGLVFAIGLGTSRGDLVWLFRRPGLLLRSFVAVSVVMLAVAILLVRLMNLPHVVAVALVAMALAPMPPILPRSMIKAGGEASFASGLLAVSGLLSLVWIPLALLLLESAVGMRLGLSVSPIFRMVLITILAPLVAGAIVARLFPGLAKALQKPVNLIATLVLAIALVAVIFRGWHAIAAQVGDGALLAVVLFAIVGLIVGHLLGGPSAEDRTVLALACALRHPGIVVVVGRMTFPEEAQIGAAALLCLIGTFACALPYILWRKRLSAAQEIV